MLVLLGFSFLAGIFTALSPCILPVLPAILAAGIAQGRLRPLGTILGLICSFSFFTLTLTWIVHATGISPLFLRYAAIALIFFFGLVMLFPKLSNWFAKITTPIADLGQKIQGKEQPSGFWGGVLFGLALGLLWTPCAGPILAAVTTLVATGSTNAAAVLMTIAYSVGAGIPMFLFAYGSGKLVQTSRVLSRYSERIRQFFGILMILFALILTLNWDSMLNQKLSQLFPEVLSEKDLPVEKHLEAINPQSPINEETPVTKMPNQLPNKGTAPELTGIVGWVNSPPLNLAELRGKVVLVDFWTYTCINCLRTLPHVKEWNEKYKDKGLVIIGVHTPEFEFEKNESNVKKAAKDLGVLYPIAIDSNYATWNAYHNRYWPAHYLIDKEGNIRDVHFGEGDYMETENAIRSLLGLPPLGGEEAPQSARPITPETYLGLNRGRSYALSIKPSKTVSYTYTSPLRENQIGLRGPWRAEDEYILAEGDDSMLEGNFLAKDVYLVLGGSSQTPLEITLDGAPYGTITVDGDKKYNIVDTSYGWHQLSLKIPKGIQAYVFTFGSE